RCRRKSQRATAPLRVDKTRHPAERAGERFFRPEQDETAGRRFERPLQSPLSNLVLRGGSTPAPPLTHHLSTNTKPFSHFTFSSLETLKTLPLGGRSATFAIDFPRRHFMKRYLGIASIVFG